LCVAMDGRALPEFVGGLLPNGLFVGFSAGKRQKKIFIFLLTCNYKCNILRITVVISGEPLMKKLPKISESEWLVMRVAENY